MNFEQISIEELQKQFQNGIEWQKQLKIWNISFKKKQKDHKKYICLDQQNSDKLKDFKKLNKIKNQMYNIFAHHIKSEDIDYCSYDADYYKFSLNQLEIEVITQLYEQFQNTYDIVSKYQKQEINKRFPNIYFIDSINGKLTHFRCMKQVVKWDELCGSLQQFHNVVFNIKWYNNTDKNVCVKCYECHQQINIDLMQVEFKNIYVIREQAKKYILGNSRGRHDVDALQQLFEIIRKHGDVQKSEYISKQLPKSIYKNIINKQQFKYSQNQVESKYIRETYDYVNELLKKLNVILYIAIVVDNIPYYCQFGSSINKNTKFMFNICINEQLHKVNYSIGKDGNYKQYVYKPKQQILRNLSFSARQPDYEVQISQNLSIRDFIIKVLIYEDNTVLLAPAGCGKTTLCLSLQSLFSHDLCECKRYNQSNCEIDKLRDIYKDHLNQSLFFTTASTAKAAVIYQEGFTINLLVTDFSIIIKKLKEFIEKRELMDLSEETKCDVENEQQIFIYILIDEISMIDGALFDSILNFKNNIGDTLEKICHDNNMKNVKFKFKYILSGDFSQLGPVQGEQHGYLFDALLYSQSRYQLVLQTINWRQKNDKQFLDVLTDVRNGKYQNNKNLQTWLEQHSINFTDSVSNMTRLEEELYKGQASFLSAKNYSCNKINNSIFDTYFKGREVKFERIYKLFPKYLKREIEAILELKIDIDYFKCYEFICDPQQFYDRLESIYQENQTQYQSLIDKREDINNIFKRVYKNIIDIKQNTIKQSYQQFAVNQRVNITFNKRFSQYENPIKELLDPQYKKLNKDLQKKFKEYKFCICHYAWYVNSKKSSKELKTIVHIQCDCRQDDINTTQYDIYNGMAGVIKSFIYKNTKLTITTIDNSSQIYYNEMKIIEIDVCESGQNQSKYVIQSYNKLEAKFYHMIEFPIQPQYAITIHKSQGATLKCVTKSSNNHKVYIDLEGIYQYNERALYTAISRAEESKQIHILNLNYTQLQKLKLSDEQLSDYTNQLIRKPKYFVIRSQTIYNKLSHSSENFLQIQTPVNSIT